MVTRYLVFLFPEDWRAIFCSICCLRMDINLPPCKRDMLCWFYWVYWQCHWSLNFLRGCVLILPKDLIRDFHSATGSSVSLFWVGLWSFIMKGLLFKLHIELHWTRWFLILFESCFCCFSVCSWGQQKFLRNLLKPLKSLHLTMSLVPTFWTQGYPSLALF